MQDDIGESPLITASGYGHVALCKLLIERGATVDNQRKVRLLYGHVHIITGVLIEWCAQLRIAWHIPMESGIHNRHWP